MSQTSVIFFGLLIGFIVFITVKGELQAYLAVIGLEGGATVAGNVPATTGGATVTVPGGRVVIPPSVHN